MRFLTASLIPVVVFLAALTAAEPVPMADDEQDLIFFHDHRAYLLRLHVQIDGRPVQESWARYLKDLFQKLDRDQNGFLERKELALAPNVRQLQQQIEGVVAVEPEPAPELADLDFTPRDDKVSAEELGEYYRRAGVGPIQVEYSWRQNDKDPLGEVLFGRFDANEDGKLVRGEVGPEVLRRFDANDNELIAALEVMPVFPGAGMVTHNPIGSAPPPPAAPFFLTHRGDAAGLLGPRLIKRYDTDKDGLLSPKEFALERRLFPQLDADKDGLLAANELNAWPSKGPDMELIVPLGENAGRERVVVLPEKINQALTTKGEDHGGLSLSLNGLRVELVPKRGNLANLEPGRKAADGMFGKADANNDAVLDTPEIFRDPFEFVGLLRLADVNDDGKLSRQELKEYHDLQAKLLACSTFLTLSDRGRPLFELIDADHDGRLNLREAGTVWERLKSFDADGDGAVTREELPRQFLLTLSHGQPKPPNQNEDRLAYGRAFQYGERSRGPVWFRKMDRNRDGDISRREFLGTAEDFRKLDHNGDGFLTLSEAEAADLEHRKN